MTDATQTTDALSLDECIGMMRRLGVAPEDYVIGYRDGFEGAPYEFGRGLSYAQGRSAGLDAWGRRAHGSDAPVSVSPWVPSRDGAM